MLPRDTQAEAAREKFARFDWVNGLATELVDLLDAAAVRTPIRRGETELEAHRRAGCIDMVDVLLEARHEALHRKD